MIPLSIACLKEKTGPPISRTVVKPLAEYVKKEAGEGIILAYSDFFEPSMVYYTGRTVERVGSLAALDAKFGSGGRVFLFVRESTWGRIKPAMESPGYVIRKRKGFSEVKGPMTLLVVSNRK